MAMEDCSFLLGMYKSALVFDISQILPGRLNRLIFSTYRAVKNQALPLDIAIRENATNAK